MGLHRSGMDSRARTLLARRNEPASMVAFRRILACSVVALSVALPAAGDAAGLGGLGGIGALPRLPLPAPNLPPVVNRTVGAVQQAAGSTVRQVVDNVGRPPRPDVFENDDRGARVVKSEVLALSPSAAGLAAAQRLNFRVLRQENLGGLNLGITVLQAPTGTTVSDALNALRAADPAGTYDYNHVYDPSTDRIAAATGIIPVATIARAPAQKLRIGMVDGGVDGDHPEFRVLNLITENLAGHGASPPSVHGTEVASVLAASGPKLSGAIPGATIFAADVYGGSPTGGSADAVAQGIAWVAGKGVPVINVSLVGPSNRLLEAVVKAAIARGHVIVAAVGNDGPATPVEYPAAYDGVIAVTSVDRQHHGQIDANQGPQVAFAALGVDVPVAAPQKAYARVTGTSFAAPVVAAWFALKIPAPDTAAAEAAYLDLQQQAIDLGDPGRDAVFGWGLLDSPNPRRESAAAN